MATQTLKPHRMTQADWDQLDLEFPRAWVPTPPVCTAYWDLEAWRAWYRASLKAQGKMKKECNIQPLQGA